MQEINSYLVIRLRAINLGFMLANFFILPIFVSLLLVTCSGLISRKWLILTVIYHFFAEYSYSSGFTLSLFPLAQGTINLMVVLLEYQWLSFSYNFFAFITSGSYSCLSLFCGLFIACFYGFLSIIFFLRL